MTNSKASPFLDQVRGAIRVRHYSIRTEQAYLAWIKQFIIFNGKRHPAELGDTEVSVFLTYLACCRCHSKSGFKCVGVYVSPCIGKTSGRITITGTC
jgi:hypothetical protein